MSSLNVPNRRKICSLKEEIFSPGDIYISRLQEKEEGLERKDFCLKCWKSTSLEEKEGLSIWKGIIPEKKNRIFSYNEKLARLLQKLLQNQKHGKLAWILAQAMVRKKQLIKVRSENYELPASGIVFFIKNEFPAPKESFQIKEQLKSMLDDAD